MKALLYSDGKIIGTCELPDNDIPIIRFSSEYYVYNDNLRGYEAARCYHVRRIEFTPRELDDPEPRLPFTKHVLFTKETCKCNGIDPCNICDGGLAVCALCGKTESELDSTSCNPYAK